MKETDTISVLVCVHSRDHEHDMLLQYAIESLVRQSYTNFKVVAVLDECHEDTKPVLEHYQSVLDISIFERPRKQGLAIAKNFGIKKCDTDWIAYLDADDQWMDCKLEIQREHMLGRPNVDFCFTEAWDNYNGFLRPNCFTVGQYMTHEQIHAALPNENVLCHGSAVIRCSAIETLGLYNTDKLYLGREDHELWQRAIQNNYTFFKVPERLYIYGMGTSVAR